MANELRVGVTGYSAQKFDEQKAREFLSEAYQTIAQENQGRQIKVVSGLTDLGIPALAYRLAVQNGWQTVGIACPKAADYACFPCDEKVIVGNDWGDESPTFLQSIDVLVRVGGGGQARRETAAAKEQGKRVLEYELAAIPAKQ